MCDLSLLCQHRNAARHHCVSIMQATGGHAPKFLRLSIVAQLQWYLQAGRTISVCLGPQHLTLTSDVT
jgi:hypothetical protein